MITQDTVELLAKGLQKFDITKKYSLDHKIEVPSEFQFIMDKIICFFGQYWKDNLKELGINESMKNYSKMYPINLLEKADVSIFGDLLNEFAGIIPILKELQNCCDENCENTEIDYDEENNTLTEHEQDLLNDLFKDFNLIKLYEFIFSDLQDEPFVLILKALFEYYQQCVDSEFEETAKTTGISKEEMTEDEKLNIWIKTMDSLNHVGTKDLMLGQRVPEIFNISKECGVIEDFSNKKENHSKIDFLRKQYWLRRKFDCILSFDELNENDLINLNPENEFDKIFDEEIDKAVTVFIDTLDDTDKTIYYMKQDGYTQEEIAIKLGYKTHSAVTKRLAKMKEKAMEYCENIDI